MSGARITAKQTEALLQGLRLGMTRRAAAAAAGMHHATFYRMIAADATLATEVEKAEGRAEAVYTGLVARAAEDPKNWTAAAWWLERRHPNEFGRKDRVEVTINTKELAQKIAGDLDADVVLAEADRILAETR